MARRSTRLAAATALSLALHFGLVLAPSYLGWLGNREPAPPLEVTFRELPPLVAAAAPPEISPPMPKSKPKRARKVARRLTSPAPAVPQTPPIAIAPAAAAEAEGPALPGPLVPESTPSSEVALAPAFEPPLAPVEAISPPPAEYPVKRAQLVYDLFHSSTHTRVGQVTHRWWTDGTHYEAESIAEAIGFFSWVFGGKFVQRSSGRIGPAGLVPESYTLERGRGAAETARFDWADGKLSLAWRDERRVVALPPGAQDAMSVMHQIYFMKPQAVSSALDVATSRKLSRYVYEVLGDADLDTPLGRLRTVHVGRVETDGSVLEIWLDKDRELLPVRVYSMDRKGTVLDQVVREVTLLE